VRPVRLEIEGLTAFREKQVIDFTDLDLFVITGPTGAGKTSVLDAVSLALYGTVARMGGGGQGNSDLISLGETSAKILLEFRAGGDSFVITRRIRRGGPQEALFERIEGATRVPVPSEGGVRAVNKSIEAILGLDFGAFARSVLLPQNQFAELLAGEARDRRELLKRLLDLDRYDRLRQRVSQKIAVLKDRVRERRTRIEAALADATENNLAAAKEEAAVAHARVKTFRAGRDKVHAAAARLDEATVENQRLARLAEELASRAEPLARLRKDWKEFAPKHARGEAEVARLAAIRDAAVRVHAASAEALADVEEETGTEASLAMLAVAAGRLNDAEAEKARLAGRIATMASEVGQLEARHAEVVTQRELAAAAHMASATAEDASRRGVDSASQACEAARKRAGAEARREQAARDLIERGSARDASTVELTEAGQVLADAEERERHMRVEHAALALRAGLSPGDLCPVCHQAILTLPEPSADAAVAVMAATQALSKARNRHDSARATAARAEARAETAAEEAQNAEAALVALKAGPSLAEARMALDEASARLDAVLCARADAAAALRGAERSLGELDAGIAGARQQLRALTSDREGAANRAELARVELLAGFADGYPADAQAVIAARRSRLADARKAEATARQTAATTARAVDDAQADRRDLDRRLDQLRARASEQRGLLMALAGRMDRIDAIGLPAAHPVLAGELDIRDGWRVETTTRLGSAQRGAEDSHDAAVGALANCVKELGLQAGGAGEARTRADQGLTRAENQAEQANAKAKDLDRRLKQRRAHEAEIADAEATINLHDVLADELKQNNFPDFLLMESVAQLATLASYELRSMSIGRYSLVADDVSFAVIDHGNADERRPVETLSGGETFLASLALAMALSQSLTDIVGSSVGAKLEAMFIDEGFGTLDPETLETVIDALERLKDSNRQIGIITHVQALADRIGAGLAIERRGRASVITRID
jgi:exonuclease SbcC